MKPASRIDPKDAAQYRLDTCGIRVGDRFVHYKGGRYEVVALAVLEATCEPAVVYLSLSRGTAWVRTLEDWTDTFEIDGHIVRRFTPEPESDEPGERAGQR